MRPAGFPAGFFVRAERIRTARGNPDDSSRLLQLRYNPNRLENGGKPTVFPLLALLRVNANYFT
jgi:hypothetical protein